jgi:hypothetical protein
MLAFDLETTGLDPRVCEITCASAWGDGVQESFIFPTGDEPEAFMQLLDAAERLCCFNGVRFDIPFMQARWAVPPERVAAWRVKVHDVFEGCRLGLGLTFSLNALLSVNGRAAKTGSGAEAVEMAKAGRWEELGAYCLADARLTHGVSSLARIRLPRSPGLVMCADGRFAAVPGGPGPVMCGDGRCASAPGGPGRP